MQELFQITIFIPIIIVLYAPFVFLSVIITIFVVYF